jgi:hypothetical protein
MYLLVSNFRFLQFRLPLSWVDPYLQFGTTNCLIPDKFIIAISAMYENSFLWEMRLIAGSILNQELSTKDFSRYATDWLYRKKWAPQEVWFNPAF